MKMKFILLCSVFGVLAASCSEAPALETDLGFEDPFVSDVIGVAEKHLSPEHWIKPGMDKVILSPSEIQAYNKNKHSRRPVAL